MSYGILSSDSRRLTARFLPRIAVMLIAQSNGVSSMATLATGRPVLNIGKISDSRFKFSFATEEGTLFCEISVPMKAGIAVSDDLRQRVAVAKLKRLLEAMDTTMKDLN
jgi:hypothetical protein